MNRGNIPGFYFDEEKQKYFQIQENHLLPQAAKHSQGNVNQEQRQHKKQKLQHQQRKNRLRQTVQRSPLLNDPILSGCGLLREQNTRSVSQAACAEEDAAVYGWQLDRTKVSMDDQPAFGSRIVNRATYLPSRKTLFYASTGEISSGESLIKCQEKVESATWFSNDLQGRDVWAANGPVTSLSLRESPPSTSLAICTHSDGPNSAFLASIPTGQAVADSNMTSVVCAHKYGGHYIPPIASVFQPHNDAVCFISSHLATLVDMSASVITRLSVTDIARTDDLDAEDCELGGALDWLTPNTMAFNCDNSLARTVMLWDTRTAAGVSSRFKLDNKVTGVRNPLPTVCQDGHQLILSTNYTIGIYDNRMPRLSGRWTSPLLQLSHRHEGPLLDCTTNCRGLIAAVSDYNEIFVYSTKTGRKVEASDEGLTSLLPPRSVTKSGNRVMGKVKSLQWFDDEFLGPSLLACQGREVLRWSWDRREDGTGE